VLLKKRKKTDQKFRPKTTCFDAHLKQNKKGDRTYSVHEGRGRLNQEDVTVLLIGHLHILHDNGNKMRNSLGNILNKSLSKLTEAAVANNGERGGNFSVLLRALQLVLDTSDALSALKELGNSSFNNINAVTHFQGYELALE
jgi:hypothetical protein